MVSLLKTIGYGALLIICSPLIALALAVLIVYTLIEYIFMEIASALRFFTGRSFKHEDAETRKLNEILNQNENIYKMQAKKAQDFVNNMNEGGEDNE